MPHPNNLMAWMIELKELDLFQQCAYVFCQLRPSIGV